MSECAGAGCQHPNHAGRPLHAAPDLRPVQYGTSQHYPYCIDGRCTGCLPLLTDASSPWVSLKADLSDAQVRTSFEHWAESLPPQTIADPAYLDPANPTLWELLRQLEPEVAPEVRRREYDERWAVLRRAMNDLPRGPVVKVATSLAGQPVRASELGGNRAERR